LRLRARREPVPFRFLPEGRAREGRPRPPGLPGAVLRRRNAHRRERGDGGRFGPARGARPRAARPARVPPGRRSARHPLEADRAHWRDGLHGARERAESPPVDPVRQRGRRARRSLPARALRAAGERGGDRRRPAPRARLRGRADRARRADPLRRRLSPAARGAHGPRADPGGAPGERAAVRQRPARALTRDPARAGGRGMSLRFGRGKREALGWLALVAPIPLPWNEVLEWPVFVAYAGIVVLFLRRARRDPERWLPRWAMNLIGLAYLPFGWLDLAVLGHGRIVGPILHLGLFALLVKLFSLAREADKWQAAIGIFFLFLAAMGTSVHPSIVLYVALFAVAGLSLLVRFAWYHVLAQFGRDEAELGPVPLRGFVAVATVASLLVAVPFFALLPRI